MEGTQIEQAELIPDSEFRSTLEALASSADGGIVIDPGLTAEQEPATNIMFISSGGTASPLSVKENADKLGAQVSTLVTEDGMGSIVSIPLSIGRIKEIVGDNKGQLGQAIDEAKSRVMEPQNRRINEQAIREIRHTLDASLQAKGNMGGRQLDKSAA